MSQSSSATGEPEVYVGDSYEDPGIRVTEAFATDDSYRIELEELAADESDLLQSDVGWKARYRLKLRRESKESPPVHEPAIIVRAKDTSDTLRIPIVLARTANKEQSATTLRLPRIGDGDNCSRVIHLSGVDLTELKVYPNGVPVFVEELIPLSDGMAVRLKITGPIASPRIPSEIFLVSKEHKHKIDIQIEDEIRLNK